MNYQDLLKLKNISEYKYLDKNVVNDINKIFSGSNIKPTWFSRRLSSSLT